MSQMSEILSKIKKQRAATDFGTDIHRRLRNIVIDGDIATGDVDLVKKIRAAKLEMFFRPDAKTEVPISGKINGCFLSRRIDRLLIDETVCFIDYKTDADKTAFRDKYIAQMNEYAHLLRGIYSDRQIRGYIIWLHDFTLEEII